MTVTAADFAKAQDHELTNWVKDVGSASRVLYELVEHGEVVGPLRRLLERPVARSLEVGVGCYGLGFLAVHMPEMCGKITGIDPLPRLDITLADRDLQTYVDAVRSRVEYRQCEGEKLPFADGEFDLIACINVVDHARDPEGILREIQRVLKPGGIFAFAVSTLSTAGELKWKFNRWRRPQEWLFVAHPHTYQWRRADAMVRSFFPNVLWHDCPSGTRRLAGRGRMSSWIVRK